jgi:hypothetical protein
MSDQEQSTSAHEELADEAEAQADDLEAKGDEVSEQIDETKKEWDANRDDDAVPGANPPELDEGGYKAPSAEAEAGEEDS